MREAARALDDVSDHLGEVLRHADELLAEWGRFGAQVRTQVEREAGAIGAVVDGAVERAASAGIDRSIADRLRGLGAEIERIEQRARAAARAVSEQREADRRVLWIVVAGVVLANALLVMLVLRKPEPARVPEPIRVEAIAPVAAPTAGSAEAGSADSLAGVVGSKAGVTDGSAAGATDGSAMVVGSAASASPGAAGVGSNAGSGSNVLAAKPGVKPPAGSKPGNSTGVTGDGSGSAKPAASPIALPQKPGAARAHKKLP